MQKYVMIFFILISGSLFGSGDKKKLAACLADLINPNKEGRTSVVKPIMRDEINVASLFLKNDKNNISSEKHIDKIKS